MDRENKHTLHQRKREEKAAKKTEQMLLKEANRQKKIKQQILKKKAKDQAKAQADAAAKSKIKAIAEAVKKSSKPEERKIISLTTNNKVVAVKKDFSASDYIKADPIPNVPRVVKKSSGLLPNPLIKSEPGVPALSPSLIATSSKILSLLRNFTAEQQNNN